MKKNLIWNILLVLGLCPFVAPIVMSVTRMSGWSFWDWIILWSFVYWPTYLLGAALIIFSVYKQKKQKSKTAQ